MMAQAHVLVRQSKYKEAYKIYLGLARQQRNDPRCIENMAFCLLKMNRPSESLLLYRQLLKLNPNHIPYLEKIAHCFITQRDFIRSGILYKKLISLDPSRTPLWNEKIAYCSRQLKGKGRWPTFFELFNQIGCQQDGPLSARNIEAIDHMNKRILGKQFLIWDLFMRHTRKLDEKYVKQHFSSVQLKSQDGRTFTVYKHPQFSFLGHFSSIQNANRILDKEIMAQLNPSVRESDDYFWNSQYKVCASLFKEGSISFFSGAMGREGLGFIIDVPNPERNILHAFCRDTWTPTFVKSIDATAVTGVFPEAVAQYYNDFMARYQVISEYIYHIYLQTEKETRYLTVLQSLEKLEELLKNAGEQQKSILQKIQTSVVSWITYFFPSLDKFKQNVEPIIKELQDKIKSSHYDPQIEDDILDSLNKMIDALETNKDETRKSFLSKMKEGVETKLASRHTPYPDKVTHPSMFRDKNKFLIIDYIDQSIRNIKPIIQNHPELETALFEKIFHYPIPSGETLVGHLKKIKSFLNNFCQKAHPKIQKASIPGPLDRAIFCRMLTPNEIFSGTEPAKYSEIGIRSNFSSHQMGAQGASFKGVVVEKVFIHGGKISNSMAELLEKAQKSHLPIILI